MEDQTRKRIEMAEKSLEMAFKCLEGQGDIDNPELTQWGNQALRHVHYALDVLKGNAEQWEK